MSKIKKNYKYYLSQINKIEQVRKKNNKNWMDILRISFKYSPKETSKVLSEIYKEDKKINKLAKKLNS
jgi:hypothetical protein